MEINIDNMVIPDHIAIILDGNGRWAKKRGLHRSMGHKEGCVVGRLLRTRWMKRHFHRISIRRRFQTRIF